MALTNLRIQDIQTEAGLIWHGRRSNRRGVCFAPWQLPKNRTNRTASRWAMKFDKRQNLHAPGQQHPAGRRPEFGFVSWAEPASIDAHMEK